VLVAELVVGLLAQRLGLPVPELAIVDVPSRFGRSEPDPEIQDLLRASHGVNVGMRYLDGAFNFNPKAAGDMVSPELAAEIVWLDAYLTNPDRTHRNPNLLVWDRRPWLIDHGAALYAQHDWASTDEARTRTAFPLIRDHVLLDRSGDLAAADARMSAALGDHVFDEVLRLVPDALLTDAAAATGRAEFDSADEARDRYRAYLATRLEGPRDFVAEAERAKERRRLEPPVPYSARR